MEGSMDLNPLWWSDNKTTANRDIVVLSKSDNSLNMNGTKAKT